MRRVTIDDGGQVYSLTLWVQIALWERTGYDDWRVAITHPDLDTVHIEAERPVVTRNGQTLASDRGAITVAFEKRDTSNTRRILMQMRGAIATMTITEANVIAALPI